MAMVWVILIVNAAASGYWTWHLWGRREAWCAAAYVGFVALITSLAASGRIIGE